MKNKKIIAVMLMLLTISLGAQETKGALKVDAQGDVIVKNNLVGGNGNTYDPLPVGTILMFSGKDWVDNVTIPGWYACTDLNNKNKALPIEVPNLEQTFIMGTNNTEVQDDTKRNGGKNELTKEDLPQHDHSINHDHAAVNSSTDGAHGHGSIQDYYFNRHSHLMNHGSRTEGTDYWYYHTKDLTYSNRVIPSGGSHKHSINIPLYHGISGSTGNGKGVGNESVMENRPKYYTVIYIIKVK